jgi:hypothetical protein
MAMPSQEILNNDSNQEGNTWYDKTRAAYSLYQKISLETTRLAQKYQNAQ